MTKNEALQAVREWREQMVKSWEGKSSEEIVKELNTIGQPFRDLEASARREIPVGNQGSISGSRGSGT